MDYANILKNIQSKQFEKFYLLHGEEGYFMDVITKMLIDNVLEEHERDFNQSIYYGKDCDILNVISDAKGYPMMAERKLVIIKEAQDIKPSDFDLIEKYLNDPSEQTIFVLNYKYKKFDSRKKVFKLAQKVGLVFHSEKVKEWNLSKWISDFVKSKGFGITEKASMLLAEFLGTDLSLISKEIDKLSLLIEKGTTINDVHIEDNIGISKDYNMFELSNAFSVRDIQKTYRIIDYFEHNPKAGNIIPIISMLFNSHIQLMKYHFITNKQNAARELRVAPFLVNKIAQTAKIYNPKKIAYNISVLHEYDLKSKGVGNSNFSQGELMKEMFYKLMH